MSLDRTSAGAKFAIIVILLIAGYVRLLNSDLTWFVQDQARDAYVASQIVSGREFPLIGVEVGGAPTHTWGPLYFYILAAPFAVSRDPSVAVAALSLLTLVSVFLAYRLGSALFGTEVGILTAALFATYPRVVMMEKGLSNITLVPLLTIIFFQSLFSLVTNQRSVMIIPVMATLAALLQLHLATLSLGVILCLALVLLRPRVRPAHLLWGIASMLVLMSPFLVAQVRSGFQDISSMTSYATGESRSRNLAGLYRLAGDILVIFPDSIVGLLDGIDRNWRSWLVQVLNRLETWLLLFGIAFVCGVALIGSLRRSVRGPRQAGFTLLSLWLIVPFLVVGQKALASPHHFELLYPAPLLAGAVFVSAALHWLTTVRERYGRYGRIGLYMLVATVVVSQVDFHRHVWRAIEGEGAIRWVSPDEASVLELMPIRYKQRLVRGLVQDFGVDREGFFHRVHGSRFLDLLEDKGYFFQTTKGRSDGEPPFKTSGFHYVIGHGSQVGEPLFGERVLAVGPYTIREYVPLIDYGTWRCAYNKEPKTPLGGWPAGPGTWFPLRLPTGGVPDLATYWMPTMQRWRALPVFCRGTMTRGERDWSRHQVVTSIRTASPRSRNVLAFYLNGQEIAARGTASRSTLGAHNRDVVFDLSDELSPGQNEIALRIDGQDLDFDLDVYEIGRSRP